MKQRGQVTICVMLVIMGVVAFALQSEGNEWQQMAKEANATAAIEATGRSIAVTELTMAQATAVAAQTSVFAAQTTAEAVGATTQVQLLDIQTTVEASVNRQAELEAELVAQQQTNLAYELALASQQLREGPQADIQSSVLLAIEAVHRQPDLNTFAALRQGLELLPDLTLKMETAHTGANRLMFSKDGRFLLSWAWDVNPRMWDTTTGEMLAFIPDDTIYDWSGNGRYLALNGWPNDPYIFDSTNEESLLTLPNLPNPLLDAATFSSDSTLVAYSTEVVLFEPSITISATFVVQNIQSSEEILHQRIEPARENAVATYSEIAFSHDGRYIAGANLFRMDIWDMTTQQIVIQYPLDLSWPTHLIFSPNNAYLVVVGFNGVKLWDVVQNQEIPLDSLHGTVQSVRFSSDSRYLLITRQEERGVGEGGSWYSGQDGTQVWDVATGAEVLHLLSVNQDASFIAETHQLLTVDKTGTIQLWDVETKQLLIHNLLDRQITIHISYDGTKIAGIDEQGQIHLWKLEPFSVTQILYPMTIYSENYRVPDNPSLLAYSPNGITVTTGVFWDGQVRFWNSENGVEQIVSNAEGIIRAWAYSDDGAYLAIGGGNHPSPAPDWNPIGYTNIWHLSEGKTITLTHESHVKDVEFSPDGRFLATATMTAQLWDINTGEEISTCAPELDPLQLDFLPEENILVVLAIEKIVLCDIQTGIVIQEFLPSNNPLFWTMAVHPNGRFMAIAENTTVRVWDLQTNTLVAELPTNHVDHQYKIAFSPNGSYLGSLSSRSSNPVLMPENALNVWDVIEWQPVIQEKVPFPTDFAFSSDSNYLAISDENGLARVLALPDGREINRWQYNDSLRQVVFRSDSKQIALLAWETVILWYWNPTDWVTEACHRLSRNLTPDEWMIYFGNEPYRPTCPY